MRQVIPLESYEVVIVGGGLVGASLGIALAPLPLRIALIESAAPPATPPVWDERCIAINHASQQIFKHLGVWDTLAVDAQPIVSTHISEAGRFGVARFTAGLAALPALGYNIPLRALGNVLWSCLQQTPVQVLCPARVTAVDSGTDAIGLNLDDGRKLSARLVVAADGANSAVRTMLGIGARTDDYQQSAIVSALRLSRPHRDCAYERFTPQGPIALLPKPGDACSLVWTVLTAQVPAMLNWSDAQFLHSAQDTFGERLGRFTALGRRHAHALSRVVSDQLTANRTLFIGNAAQSLHPVAAQGFNLGLRDAASVAELLADGADPGAAEQLQTYQQRRAQDRERVSAFTDQLVRLFSNRVPGLRGLRHLGLLALDLAPPLKAAVMWQNLGYAGRTPALARESP